MNIKDIAKMANVSVATVSRVINGNTNVKQPVREKIEEIIRQNNYVPSSLGIALLKKKSNVIGIILPVVHSYYTERFNSIAKICSENGYGTIIFVTNYDEKQELKALSDLRAKNVDGLIFMTTKITSAHLEIMAKYKDKIPLVVIDADASENNFSSILQDDYSGAKDAVSFLISSGHKKIAFISGDNINVFSTSERYKAYFDTMSSYGLKIITASGNYSMRSGYEAVDTLLSDKSNIPTAIFCANDSMAMGASRRLHELGYKIPDDISLIGVDDLEHIKYLSPAALTTVRQDLSESGRIAADLVMEYIKNGVICTDRIVMKQKLIVRESVKRL